MLGLSLQPRDWSIKMNKKERRLALSTALQSASDSITIIEDVGVRPCPGSQVTGDGPVVTH